MPFDPVTGEFIGEGQGQRLPRGEPVAGEFLSKFARDQVHLSTAFTEGDDPRINVRAFPTMTPEQSALLSRIVGQLGASPFVGGGTFLPQTDLVAGADPGQILADREAGVAAPGVGADINAALGRMLSGEAVGAVDPELFRQEARATFDVEESALGDRVDEIAHRFGVSGRSVAEASEAFGDFGAARALGVAQAGRQAAEINSRAAQFGAGLQTPGVAGGQSALAQLMGAGSVMRGISAEQLSEPLFRALAAQTPNPMNALAFTALGTQPFGTFAASGSSSSAQQAQMMSAIGGLLGGIGGLAGGIGGAMGSSRKIKTLVDEVDPIDVLEKVGKLEVDRWIYTGAEEEHIGPYAEDFREAFDLGDGKTINYIDAIGVLFAAVKGLKAEVERLRNG